MNDKRAVLITNLAEGVTVEDVEATFEEFGKIDAAKALAAEGSASPSFELTFASETGAASAIAAMDGTVADGQRVHVTYVTKDKSAPLLERVQGIEEVLDREQRSSRRDATPPRHKREQVDGLPEDMLKPYTSLLQRAGVDSLSTLRKLVRPGSVKEYIDELAKEYPDEDLLRGFTAKWALRDRLEDWLDVKAPASEWEPHRV